MGKGGTPKKYALFSKPAQGREKQLRTCELLGMTLSVVAGREHKVGRRRLLVSACCV